MSDPEGSDLPGSGLEDALQRAASGPPSGYTVDDVRRTARWRIRRRRALGGAVLVVAVIAGVGLATAGNDTSTTDVVGQPDVATVVTTTVVPAETSSSSVATPTSAVVTTAAAVPPTSPSSLPAVATTAEPPLCSTLPDDARLIEANPYFVAKGTTAADLDGDGIGDPLYVGGAQTGHPLVQAVLSSNGAVTEPVGLFLLGPGETVDAADVDGDGRDEAFVMTGGATAFHGVILDLDSCELRAITDGISGGVFSYLGYADGISCAVTGCFVSVTCQKDSPSPLITLTEAFMGSEITLVGPDANFEQWLKVPRNDLPIHWWQKVVRIVDGRTEVVSEVEKETTIGAVGGLTGPQGVACSETLAG